MKKTSSQAWWPIANSRFLLNYPITRFRNYQIPDRPIPQLPDSLATRTYTKRIRRNPENPNGMILALHDQGVVLLNLEQ